MKFKIGVWDVPVLFDLKSDESRFGYYTSLPTPRVVITKPGAVGRNYPTTVIHELLHALSDINGLALSESKVRALEQGLCSIILSNPKGFMSLVKSLTGAQDPTKGTKSPKRKKSK